MPAVTKFSSLAPTITSRSTPTLQAFECAQLACVLTASEARRLLNVRQRALISPRRCARVPKSLVDAYHRLQLFAAAPASRLCH